MQVYNALQLKKGAKTEQNRLGSITQPLQFLPKKDKTEEWAAWNLDWLEWQGLKQIRRNARRLMKNYKLAKGIIDRTDYIIEEDNEFSIYNLKSIIIYLQENIIQIILLILVFVIIFIVDYISNVNTIQMSQMNVIPQQSQNNIKIHKKRKNV